MPNQSADRPTMTHLMVPVSLMSFTLCLLFAFQTTHIIRDRHALEASIQGQTAALEQNQKLNAQFGGLVAGTQKLAQEGNATAKDLVEKLKNIGVIPTAAPGDAPAGMAPAAPMPAPVPAAQQPPQPAGPVKP